MGNTPWSNETERAEWYMREYERLRKRQEELPTGGQLIVKGAVLIEHEEETEDTPVKYIKKNKDDIEQAVKCLDEFTHNWCMNCKEQIDKVIWYSDVMMDAHLSRIITYV